VAYTNIDDPSAHFQTKLYTGTGASHSVTFDGNSNMQPDLVWNKRRNAAYYHRLWDSNRGVTKYLASNDSIAEATFGYVSSFDTDGVTFGSSDQSVNTSGGTYVLWNWKCNGGTTSSNTDGSITSTVQANTDAGFSIVTYTGNGGAATLGHGLGVKPNWIIVKSRSNALDWEVYHSSLGATRRIRLNTTGADSDQGDLMWNDTEPTTSVFSIGNNDNVGGSGKTYIAYCFAEKQGYSKFGKYFGNGSSDGPFVYTGFKPRWIIQKNASTAATSWFIYDSVRDTGNPLSARLAANAADAETSATYSPFDFCSNGFKLRDGTDIWNESGSTHIYMAFAENPFVTSTGIPTTAR